MINVMFCFCSNLVHLWLINHRMIVIYLMIGVSIVIAVLFLILFLKSVKSGQYEDMYTPSVRMLFDDELIEENKEN